MKILVCVVDCDYVYCLCVVGVDIVFWEMFGFFVVMVKFVLVELGYFDEDVECKVCVFDEYDIVGLWYLMEVWDVEFDVFLNLIYIV